MTTNQKTFLRVSNAFSSVQFNLGFNPSQLNDGCTVWTTRGPANGRFQLSCKYVNLWFLVFSSVKYWQCENLQASNDMVTVVASKKKILLCKEIGRLEGSITYLRRSLQGRIFIAEAISLETWPVEISHRN